MFSPHRLSTSIVCRFGARRRWAGLGWEPGGDLTAQAAKGRPPRGGQRCLIEAQRLSPSSCPDGPFPASESPPHRPHTGPHPAPGIHAGILQDHAGLTAPHRSTGETPSPSTSQFFPKSKEISIKPQLQSNMPGLLNPGKGERDQSRGLRPQMALTPVPDSPLGNPRPVL